MKYTLALIAGLTIFMGAGCLKTTAPSDATTPTPTPAAENTDTMTYTETSWKEIIQDTCMSFFDGCNNCFRTEAGNDDLVGCTKKFCPVYEKPTCLDE